MPQLALILAMALWASTFVVLKIVFAEIAPLWVICARMWIASLALLAVYRRWGEARYERGDWRLIASMSLSPGFRPRRRSMSMATFASAAV